MIHNVFYKSVYNFLTSVVNIEEPHALTVHEHFKKVELFINITQEDYRRKSGVPYWKLILIQERKKERSINKQFSKNMQEVCH